MYLERVTPQVQNVVAQLIRSVAAALMSLACTSAKKLYASGATLTLIEVLRNNTGDSHVADNGLMALLGGGFHGRSVKPGLTVEAEFEFHAVQFVMHVADAVAVRDWYSASVGSVLALALRVGIAASGGEGGRMLGGILKKFLRRLIFGSGGGGDAGSATAQGGGGGSDGNSGASVMMTQTSSTSGWQLSLRMSGSRRNH